MTNQLNNVTVEIESLVEWFMHQHVTDFKIIYIPGYMNSNIIIYVNDNISMYGRFSPVDKLRPKEAIGLFVDSKREVFLSEVSNFDIFNDILDVVSRGEKICYYFSSETQRIVKAELVYLLPKDFPELYDLEINSWLGYRELRIQSLNVESGEIVSISMQKKLVEASNDYFLNLKVGSRQFCLLVFREVIGPNRFNKN